MQLFRPIGLREAELIAASGWTAFPPRLAEQPFFYPVLSRGYAEQIARDWNTVDAASGFIGLVTEFDLDDAHAAPFEPRIVGGREHAELWVPAEQLAAFNAHLVGTISVSSVFLGSAFSGRMDEARGLPLSVVAAELGA